MTIQGQNAGPGKKCIHRFANGTSCDQDAASGSNYCANHGPAQSSHSGGGGGPFRAKGIVYFTAPKDPNEE